MYNPGCYWFAVCDNASDTVKLEKSANCWLGGPGFDNDFTNMSFVQATVSWAALPAAFPAVTSVSSSTAFAIMVRVASIP